MTADEQIAELMQLAETDLAEFLEFATAEASNAGMITTSEIRAFARRLRRAKNDDARARVVNQWVETLTDRLQERIKRQIPRLPPSLN